MLYYNATLYPMTSQPIPHGYLLVEDGKIQEIGTGVPPHLAESIDRVDLQGQSVYPGFIDGHTHLGMWEDGLTFEGDDGNEETDPVTPQLRSLDAINPLDRCFTEALDAGVTTVITGPGSANAIGGQMTALKTYGKRVDTMVLKAPVGMKMALGENPKTVYNGKSQTPMTRMATVALIREQLYKAKAYQEALEKAIWSEKEDEDPIDRPEYDAKCESLLPVLRGELPVHIHAHRADDVFTALRLQKEFGFALVLVHGTEAHLIAEELSQEGVSILHGPILCDRSKPELRNLSVQSPALLQQAGLMPALITDHPVVPIQYLRLCASLAVAEGMDREEALKAITYYPAKYCGIDHRVGALQIGLDADFVVFDTDPLAIGAKPTMVVINGKQVGKQEGSRGL